MTEPGRLFLARHGATEWSEAGKHTSTTDVSLTPEGEADAAALRPVLKQQSYALVLTSPSRRARRTAELAGFPNATVDDDLVEWGYGDYEGITTDEIRETVPGWTVWTHPSPGGETPEQVTERLDRVIARVRDVQGDTLAVAHGHCLRALAARWLGFEVSYGQYFELGTATISILGEDRGVPSIEQWNAPVSSRA